MILQRKLWIVYKKKCVYFIYMKHIMWSCDGKKNPISIGWPSFKPAAITCFDNDHWDLIISRQ